MLSTIRNLIIILTLFFSIVMHAESWSVAETHHFSILESLYRAQGLASDNEGHFWFSSWNSLIMTRSKAGGIEKQNTSAIPSALSNLGCNHIGDIAYSSGKIYAPIEDGNKYLHPFIGVFNATTLQIEKYFSLPLELQKDGVPWVAVNSNLGHVYSSEYSNMNRVNVYDIKSFQNIGFINSSKALHSVQGAKMHNGYLYLTANGVKTGFALYKMNITNGDIEEVAQYPKDIIEVEGFDFAQENGQDKIIALGVVPLGGLKQMVLMTFVANSP